MIPRWKLWLSRLGMYRSWDWSAHPGPWTGPDFIPWEGWNDESLRIVINGEDAGPYIRRTWSLFGWGYVDTLKRENGRYVLDHKKECAVEIRRWGFIWLEHVPACLLT